MEETLEVHPTRCLSMKMKVSLIIPTYNRGHILCNTIELAIRQSYSDYEVIVVDQSASYEPDVQQRLNGLLDRINYHRLPNPNLPAARNFGIGVSSGEVIVFIDDDVVIERDYIDSHLRNYIDDKVGAVMGLTFESETLDVEHCLTNAQKVFEISGPVSLGGVYPVSWVVGCNMSFRRSALIEAGMFDESFDGSGVCEDADMAVRVRAKGYSLLLDTRFRLIHLMAQSGGCENRSADQVEHRAVEQLIHCSYYLIKNRSIFGKKLLFKTLFHAYRQYALNRRTITLGLGNLVRRHIVYVTSIRQALKKAKLQRRVLTSSLRQVI